MSNRTCFGTVAITAALLYASTAVAGPQAQPGLLRTDVVVPIETAAEPMIEATSFVRTVVDPKTAKRLKFQQLVKDWRRDRGARSSITQMVALPAYQSIIGMGPDAVPLIIAELKSEGDEPDQWFCALKAITGTDPVDPEDQGDYLRMAHAWTSWAETDEEYAG